MTRLDFDKAKRRSGTFKIEPDLPHRPESSMVLRSPQNKFNTQEQKKLLVENGIGTGDCRMTLRFENPDPEELRA